MELGTGIAIAGIWIGAAISCFPLGVIGVASFGLATIATMVIMFVQD